MNCKDCAFWNNIGPGPSGQAPRFYAWGQCELGTIKSGRARHLNAPIYLEATGDRYLLTREDFGCNQFRNRQGREFVKLVEEAYRAVDKDYANVERKPRGVAFHILTLLDGSGENPSGESRYRVCVEQDGEWRPVDFMHHDLE